MVRMTTWLCRVPVIKFKKGGLVQTPPPAASAAAAASPGSCPAPRAVADDPPSDKNKKALPKMLGIIKIPKGVLMSGPRRKEVVSLQIVLQKQEACSKRVH